MNGNPLELAAWELVLDELRAEDLPALATDALVRGVDSPTMVELAGQLPSDTRTSRDLFHKVLDELGIELPAHDEAVWNLIHSTARAMVEGRVSVEAGLNRIDRWARPLDVEESGDLRVFVGLADQLDVDPEARAAIEDEILVEVRELLRRPRPRVWIKLQASLVGRALTRTVRYNSFDLDPEDLPISDELHADLTQWTDQHAAQMTGWPRTGGFSSVAEAERFVAEGEQLVTRLQRQLGPGYRVEYTPEPLRPPNVRLRNGPG